MKEHSKYCDHTKTTSLILLHKCCNPLHSSAFHCSESFSFNCLRHQFHLWRLLRYTKMIAPSLLVILAFQFCSVNSYQLLSKRMQVTMASNNPFGAFLGGSKPASGEGEIVGLFLPWRKIMWSDIIVQPKIIDNWILRWLSSEWMKFDKQSVKVMISYIHLWGLILLASLFLVYPRKYGHGRN